MVSVVVGVRIDKRLNDAVADGAICIHFPGIYGALSLVGRDREHLYKSAPSHIRFGVLGYVVSELLRYNNWRAHSILHLTRNTHSLPLTKRYAFFSENVIPLTTSHKNEFIERRVWNEQPVKRFFLSGEVYPEKYQVK